MTDSRPSLLSRFDTSLVSDTLDDLGIDGVIDGIRPAGGGSRIAGRVDTVGFSLVTDGETDFPHTMLGELRKNRILLLSAPDSDRPISCWGGNATRLAANAGAAGIVIDGGYRDVEEVREQCLPVFGRTPTPRTGQGRIQASTVGDQIEINGVTVAPDDVILADDTGVVVIPDDALDDVIADASDRYGEEQLLEAKIDAGATPADLRREGREF